MTPTKSFRGVDVEPLIKLAASIAQGDGHVQFSVLVNALVLLAKAQNISRKIIHRGIDASWDLDGRAPSAAPINLVDH